MVHPASSPHEALVPRRREDKVAYVKFENPQTQHAFEEAAEGDPEAFEVVRRWRLFGERAIRADLASHARLLRKNEELLARRRGRFAVLGETAEEKVELATSYNPLGDTWEAEE
jgi:hypothetical protein